jgi:hypothetical protein
MREMVTKCDECRKEIPDTTPSIIVVLGIAKREIASVDIVTKEVLKRPDLPKPIEEYVKQKEVCTFGCAYAFFKRELGNGHSDT